MTNEERSQELTDTISNLVNEQGINEDGAFVYARIKLVIAEAFLAAEQRGMLRAAEIAEKYMVPENYNICGAPIAKEIRAEAQKVVGG